MSAMTKERLPVRVNVFESGELKGVVTVERIVIMPKTKRKPPYTYIGCLKRDLTREPDGSLSFSFHDVKTIQPIKGTPLLESLRELAA